jgi:hypothetical protein
LLPKLYGYGYRDRHGIFLATLGYDTGKNQDTTYLHAYMCQKKHETFKNQNTLQEFRYKYIMHIPKIIFIFI